MLFVDDDAFLLEALRDALRPYRGQWSMKFVTSGADALSALSSELYDVVVSDLRMPGMDGAALLEAVRDQHPEVVRVVLSGHAEIEMAARAAGAAHRMIAKPCETDELARVIERSCALRGLSGRVEVDRRAIGASTLPSVPRLYAELTGLLATGSAGAADAAEVVERDIAMSAKVLQLANSAYFGRRTPVTKISDAVAYLGIEALRALVLQAEVFREFPLGSAIVGFDLEALHGHCTHVARLAAALSARTGASRDAFTAGLLHDVGLLVLASQDPAGLSSILASAQAEHRPLYQVERDAYGVTHADIGAHLLALWGLPPTVTEAVAGHHEEEWLRPPFDTVGAVYVANILVEEVEAEQTPDGPTRCELPLGYLQRAGVADQVHNWRELARRQCAEAHG